MAIAVAEYMVYHEANPRKALDLAAECTHRAGFKDWWWKAIVGKCYYKLGERRSSEAPLYPFRELPPAPPPFKYGVASCSPPRCLFSGCYVFTGRPVPRSRATI